MAVVRCKKVINLVMLSISSAPLVCEVIPQQPILTGQTTAQSTMILG